MKSKRFFTFAGLVAGLFLLAGCLTTLAPKTTALQHVHELYREEFTLLELPTIPKAVSSSAPGAAFAKSLNAIHDYRLSYPQESQELAHLQVLEGMIYLQARRFGLAAAVKDDVVAAGKKLTSVRGTEKTGADGARVEGALVRDSLFAANFDSLLRGWNETRAPNPSVEVFEGVADELVSKLKGVSEKQLPELERDDGALYLATSAAIFYAWASAREDELNFAADATKKAELAERKKKRNEKASDIIGKFLTPAEKTAKIEQDIPEGAQGRLRYLLWYHYFDPAKP